MFTKEESRLLRQEFWTSFGKSFPRKWVLYNTGIKDFSFKFYFDTKKAGVTLAIEDQDLEKSLKYYEKLQSLKTILLAEYVPKAVFQELFLLENGKEIFRIYVEIEGVSIHDKTTWKQTMEFLHGHMRKFEAFWFEYEDIIKT